MIVAHGDEAERRKIAVSEQFFAVGKWDHFIGP